MSNLRALFWLSVLTVAALAADFFVGARAPSVRTLANRTLLDPEFPVTRLALARPDAPETVLVKEGDWRLERPYAGSADARIVLRLLDALAATPVSETLSETERTKLGRELADFGLATPSLRLAVSGAAGEKVLSFGDSTPSSNGTYVAVSGSSAVLIVPGSVRAAADLRPEAFRARNLFPYAPEFVSGFDLRQPGASPVTVARAGEGWRVGDTAAKASKVRDFLARLTEANALDFHWPVGATNEGTVASEALLVGYGLDSGTAVTLNLHCGDGVDRRMSFGNGVGTDRVYALVHNGGAVVSVDAALKAMALEGMRAFEDARLFPVDAGSVASFTLADGETSYVLARAGEEAWRLDSPVAAPADSAVAVAILGRLLALTSADVAEKGLTVSISTNGEQHVVSPVAVLGDVRIEDLRSREILRLDATLVRRLVSTPGGRSPAPPVAVVHSRERRCWNAESEGTEAATVDERNVEAALAALSPLKAERIVALRVTEAELSRYGLDEPHHTIAVDQEKEGAVRRNVFIGSETAGGRFATVGSSEAIFVLSEKTVSALTAPLLAD